MTDRLETALEYLADCDPENVVQVHVETDGRYSIDVIPFRLAQLSFEERLAVAGDIISVMRHGLNMIYCAVLSDLDKRHMGDVSAQAGPLFKRRRELRAKLLEMKLMARRLNDANQEADK